jgi:hypothetical protein
MLRADWRADWLKRLEAEPYLAPRWARHQSRDAYWRHGSVCEDYSALQAKVLSFSGWADNYMNTSAHLVANVPGAKAIVGPWVHQYPHTAVPGPQVGFLDIALRWWDCWLKDVPNGAQDDPSYRVYMLESAKPDASAKSRAGHWVAETYPPLRGSRQVFALSPGGTLGGSGGDLTDVIATPQHLGLMAGEFFPMGLNAEMPGDQGEDDALSVCFDTAPLPDGMALLGATRLTLRLSSDQPLAFVVARLCDVAPDGSSVRIAHGMLNLCHRDGMADPMHLVPGQATDIAFDLDQMAYRLAPGHQLRLALSNSYWPFVWPSPKAARLTLHAGSLDVPVHTDTALDEWTPPPPRMARPWAHNVLKQGRAVRRVERDLIGGGVTVVIEDDTGKIENATHGLITRETMVERWSVHPDDPARAMAEITWEQSQTRGDWHIRTRTTSRMTADGPNLVMTARLQAWEGDAVIFERNFHELVARDFI